MDASKTFVVAVERATPACGSSCPNLEIIAERETLRGMSAEGPSEYTITNFRCVNDSYCKHLWETMEERTKSETIEEQVGSD